MTMTNGADETNDSVVGEARVWKERIVKRGREEKAEREPAEKKASRRIPLITCPAEKQKSTFNTYMRYINYRFFIHTNLPEEK